LGVAKQSLTTMLGATDLKRKSFLDAGCGSGLFSLAARAPGASVHSFDYDPNSVRCAQELRRRYFPKDPKWTIAEASVLNETYLAVLTPSILHCNL
jgi:ribosomal protein L11 methylase PrmA